MMVTALLRDITSSSVCTPAIGTGVSGVASLSLKMARIGSGFVVSVCVCVCLERRSTTDGRTDGLTACVVGESVGLRHLPLALLPLAHRLLLAPVGALLSSATMM
jgi:hypothetical protein